MWKWLGGCLVIVIVLIIGFAWWGFRAMRGSVEPDGSVRVAILATPERVFATMANADSVSQWMAQGNTVSVSQPGVFVPGSRIRITLRSSVGVPQEPMEWVVRDVVPNHVLVRELVTEKGQRAAVRLDTLEVKGDSTVIRSFTVSPMIDSIVVATDKKKGTTNGGMTGVTGDLMLSMFRFQSKIELRALKAHIEGKPFTVK